MFPKWTKKTIRQYSESKTLLIKGQPFFQNYLHGHNLSTFQIYLPCIKDDTVIYTRHLQWKMTSPPLPSGEGYVPFVGICLLQRTNGYKCLKPLLVNFTITWLYLPWEPHIKREHKAYFSLFLCFLLLQ